MIIKSGNINTMTENGAEGGKGILHLDKLHEVEPPAKNVRLFSIATLEPGADVGYHQHIGEIEYYYILSGYAVYNDNGKEYYLAPGDLTYTPDGESHGIKNLSETENLVFIALVVKESQFV